jgi:hypothetical protein
VNPGPVSRRDLLRAGGVTLAAGALAGGGQRRASAAAQQPTTVTIDGTALGTGSYNYHPFQLPAGVNRLDVTLTKRNAPQRNAVGLGIFDPRGSHYGTRANPNGFRGIFGEERSAFTITPSEATNAFIPGPLPAGSWTLIVPVFTVGPEVLQYTITVTMGYGDAPQAFVLGRDIDLVRDEPGWYRGDLHAHTQASSDALSSGSAQLPTDWAATCRRIGLDFLALTDHNVVSQNFHVAADAGDSGVLLLAGEEMTNWFYGHATVSGISPGDWFDWRQLPGQAYTGAAVADPTVGRIQDFLAHTRELGAFVSAAHPLGATLAWRFFPDAVADEKARTDSVEVWTGPFQPDDQASVDTWDSMLKAGQHLVANGGSDLHGVVNTGGFAAGTPTTVVHASALGKGQVIAALKAGRSFITRVPRGAEAYLSVRNPAGDQRQIMGGTVYGAATDLLTVEVAARRAGGLRLVLLRDGAVLSTTPLTDPDQTVTTTLPLATDGYLRAELRGASVVDPVNPLASRLDMEALTNPVWLRLGPVPEGTVRDDTQPPPPDGQATPAMPEVATAALLPLAGLAAGAAALAVRHRGGGPRPVTHTEFALLGSDAGWRETVELVGEVTGVTDAGVVLTRWVPGCCSTDAALDVLVTGLPSGPRRPDVGQWWSAVGRADGRVDAAGRQIPVLRAAGGVHVSAPPPRREA